MGEIQCFHQKASCSLNGDKSSHGNHCEGISSSFKGEPGNYYSHPLTLTNTPAYIYNQLLLIILNYMQNISELL